MELLKILAKAAKIIKMVEKGKMTKEKGREQLIILKVEGICKGFQSDKNFKKVFDKI